jgi:hypothetical protein
MVVVLIVRSRRLHGSLTEMESQFVEPLARLKLVLPGLCRFMELWICCPVWVTPVLPRFGDHRPHRAPPGRRAAERERGYARDRGGMEMSGCQITTTSRSRVSVGGRVVLGLPLNRARIGLRLPFFGKNHVLIAKNRVLYHTQRCSFSQFSLRERPMSKTMFKWVNWGGRKGGNTWFNPSCPWGWACMDRPPAFGGDYG